MNINQLKQSLKEVIRNNDSGFYLDVNYLYSYSTRIEKDLVNTTINQDSDKGVKFRIWDGEKFLEYGTSKLDKTEFEEAVEKLVEKAQKNQEDIKTKQQLSVNTEEITKDFISEPKIPASSKTLEEKTKLVEEIRDDVKKLDEDIVNVRSIYIEEEDEHIFISKTKELYQKVPLSNVLAAAFVKCDDGKTRMVYSSIIANGLEAFDDNRKEFPKIVEKIQNVKKAKSLEGGKYQVVLSPHLSGLLAHESFGHGMEADTMMKDRALASNWLGKQIGSEQINIVDYPSVAGKHGELHFDFEGNIAHKTYLVKEGKINQPMADLYSKTRLGLDHSSNARIESFDHKHYTRMTNTYFEPGDKTVDELISQVKDGIYITGSSGGMEDPKGWGVQLQGCFGQRIIDGKLVDEFYDDFALTGFLPDIIGSVRGLSKEIEIQGGRFCGKGHKEWVRVSEGGPHMLIDEVILG